jgi:hypothetical protein
MTKAERMALEKVFAAEINGRLPYQSKAKIFASLAEQGLVQHIGISRCEGWQLSHAGRLLYCMSCGDEESP